MFSFKFTLRCQQSDIVPFIHHPWQLATGVINLPPISLAKLALGAVDTGGKFATGVVDTGGAT